MSDEPKSKTIHRRTFYDATHGKTPAQLHREIGLGSARCSFCDDPAAVRANIFADADELAKRDPAGYVALAQEKGGVDPAFDSKWGRIVRCETQFACDRCKESMRKALAHKPDWMFVDFDDAGEEKRYAPVVQVPR
jgi:hypothetical protein